MLDTRSSPRMTIVQLATRSLRCASTPSRSAINPPHEVNVIIEVPVGGEPIKYEMDKEAGTLVVDRFLYTAMRYPGNYGFIPHTLSGDGDPCDVLVANTRAIVPGAVMSVRPVGVLLMEDEAGGDEKIIAVPSSKLTQRYDKVKTYSDLPEITLQQIQHFFEHYKDLEPGKWVKVLRWGGAEEAHRLILEGIARAKAEDRRTRAYAVTLRSLSLSRRAWRGLRALRSHVRQRPAELRELVMRRLSRFSADLILLIVAARALLAGVLAYQRRHPRLARRCRSRRSRACRSTHRPRRRRLAEAIRFQTISNYDQSGSGCRRAARPAGAYRCKLPGVPCRREARDRSASHSLLYTWEGTDPKRTADRAAGASGRGADRAGHREGLAAAALRGRHRGRLHLGPRLVGRQGQSLRDARSRGGNGQSRVSARSARSISPSAHDEEVGGSAAQRRSPRCWHRAACGSISCSTKACSITDGIMQGPRQAGGADRRRREGLRHAGADGAGAPPAIPRCRRTTPPSA